MSIPCRSDGSCPPLYECIYSSNTCEHLPIFPFTLYPLLIYLLFPFCSAICNMSGNSFGQYKVILLMDLLNYQANQATVLLYPLITGTALVNAFFLIFKRHPTKNTTLIDYNIVMVLLPNNLFGSAIGGLVNKFMPPIAADCICVVLMFAFSIKFFMRYRGFKKQEQQQAKLQAKQLKDTNSIQNESIDNKSRVSQHAPISINQQLSRITTNRQTLLENINHKIQDQPQKDIEEDQLNRLELQKYMKYQSGMHYQHILATFVIFLIFQTLSFLAQGKIVSFSMCSIYYPIGMSLLTLIFICFDIGMYKYTSNRMKWFKKIGYNYSCDLDQTKIYLLVCFGGFIGGFNGGVFGIGASTTMIFTLLYMNIIPPVVSATVGFEILFTGLGSLSQALATDQIKVSVAGFFFMETLIFGGILTYFARKFLNRFTQVKVNQCLMLIVFSLVSGSFIALIISIVLGYIQFGASDMNSVPFQC